MVRAIALSALGHRLIIVFVVDARFRGKKKKEKKNGREKDTM